MIGLCLSQLEIGICGPYKPASKGRRMSTRRFDGILSDDVLECVFHHLDDPIDRKSISQVNKQWHKIDSITRKHVTVVSPYAVKPSVLVRRFKNLKSIKIKGKPRPYDFALLPKDWGGFARPWILEITKAAIQFKAYPALQSIHLRRLEVIDEDLTSIARTFSSSLQVFRLDKCTGFTTKGVHAVAHCCRGLKELYLEESLIEDLDGEWFHELALHNSQLEVLKFSLTGLQIDMDDLAMLLRNCKSLISLKLSEVDAGSMRKVITSATCLKELAVCYPTEDQINNQLELPRSLVSFSGDIPWPIDSSIALNLIQLNLMSTSTLLTAEVHNELIKSCANLQILKVRNIIGDAGLEVLGNHCKKLRSLRIENLEDQHGFVSHRGLLYLAQNCRCLQSVAIYASDITSSALSAFGESCPNLVDFRIALLESDMRTTPSFDDGVKNLLEGCSNMVRLAIYIRHGGLTNEGLAHIGRYGGKIRWLLLGCVGENNEGFRALSGCVKLRKLELRDCPITEAGIAATVRSLQSLRYIWAQGYEARNPSDFLAMGPYWNIEYSPLSNELPVQLIAYRSLAGPRTDHPKDVIPIISKNVAC